MKVFARRYRLRAAVVAFVIGLAGLSGTAIVGAPAAAASSTDGFVRLAHLSPDTPSVDVYLNALTFTMKQQVFYGVAYGTVSAYEMVPPGTYSVAMRPSGAKPDTPPVITTNVTVAAGHAYTVAGVGKHAALGLKVYTDNLSSPLDGRAMVRIVQASIKAPLLNVSVKGGAAIASNVPFATTTTYRSVSPGVLTLLVGPVGGTAVPLNVTLLPNSVYSILVLDGPHALTAQLRTDAVTKGVTPVGSVATGGGGLTSKRLFLPALYVAGGAIVLTLLLALRRRRYTEWTTRPASHRTRHVPSRSL
ncbi:MAG TPA: DUF4397 domain-containing protein [Micromonosporaceae bacterium]